MTKFQKNYKIDFNRTFYLCNVYFGFTTLLKGMLFVKNISILSDIKNIPTVTEFANVFLEKNHLDFSKKTDIVLDEILSNIAKYAYHDDSGKIDIDFDYDDNSKTLMIRFTDSGFAFNPLEVKEADTTATAEDRPIGGLGIFIVKCIMDEAHYERTSDKNILTLKKFF